MFWGSFILSLKSSSAVSGKTVLIPLWQFSFPSNSVKELLSQIILPLSSKSPYGTTNLSNSTFCIWAYSDANSIRLSVIADFLDRKVIRRTSTYATNMADMTIPALILIKYIPKLTNTKNTKDTKGHIRYALNGPFTLPQFDFIKNSFQINPKMGRMLLQIIVLYHEYLFLTIGSKKRSRILAVPLTDKKSP